GARRARPPRAPARRASRRDRRPRQVSKLRPAALGAARRSARRRSLRDPNSMISVAARCCLVQYSLGIEMERELSGKRALVTGASRGIGLAVARRLARAGARVAMNAGHSRERLLAAAAEVEGSLACFADVGDPAAVEAMLDTIKSEFGGLDILVNNA